MTAIELQISVASDRDQLQIHAALSRLHNLEQMSVQNFVTSVSSIRATDCGLKTFPWP